MDLVLFCEWIEARSDGLLVGGENLHRGFWPKEATGLATCVTSQTPSERDLRNNEDRMLQCITRGPEYDAAAARAEAIANLICNRLGIAAIPGWFIYGITGGGAGYLGQNENGLHVFSANYLVQAKKEG